MHFLFNRYVSPNGVFIWTVEVLLIFLSALLAMMIRFTFDTARVIEYDPFLIKTAVLTITYVLVFYYFNLYRPEYYNAGRGMAMRLVQAVVVANIVLFSVYYIIPSLKAWRGVILVNVFVLPVIIVAWRAMFARKIGARLPEKKVLIIGTGDLAKKIGMDIYAKKGHGLRLEGFIDDNPARLGQSIVNPGVIGGYGDITSVVKSRNIDRIIVAIPDRRAKLPMSALLDCKLRGVTIEEGETFQERMIGKIPLDQLKPSWMVFSDGFKSLRSRKMLKRVLDLTIALLGIMVLSPLFVLTAVLIKLDSRGPVIFRQTRTGEHGREFEIYKFRSMVHDAEKKTGPVWTLQRDDRITRVGGILRKFRIDELPQLINVVKGDMSFVGPRPERPFFVMQLKASIPYYEIRSVVKPGITGWAQIKYPYGASFKDAMEKLQYDIYYIKNMSPLLDLMIILMTIKVVLRGSGAR